MMTSIGDLARNLVLQRQTGALKAEVDRLSQELATGRVADTIRRARGDTAPVSAVEIGLARANALRDAASAGLRRADALQTAMAGIDAGAGSVYRDILGLGPEPTMATVANVAADARGRFEDAVSVLRSSSGGRSLFGGAAVDGPAIADAATILAGVDAAVLAAGATTPEEIVAAVTDWFDDPAGFAATAYLGSTDPEGPIPTGGGEGIALTLTALDPGLRRTLAALASAARAGDPSLAPGAGAAILRETVAVFASASDGRIAAAEALGRAERRLAEAVTARGAEATALSISRNELVSSDPFEVASALQGAQRQIETIYAVTARLARLSLADFLR